MIHIITTITSDPISTVRSEISRSSRLFSAASPAPSARTSFNPARNAEIIVGSVRSSVINPAAATAPAPIGRMYCRHISSGVICGIGIVEG